MDRRVAIVGLLCSAAIVGCRDDDWLGAGRADASVADAAPSPDAWIATRAPEPSRTYVLLALFLYPGPTSGCDLDGDGTQDLGLNTLFSFLLRGALLEDPALWTDRAIGAGEITVLFERRGDAGGPTSVQAFDGRWAGPGPFDLGLAFSGRGSFAIDGAGSRDLLLSSGGTGVLGGTTFQVPLVLQPGTAAVRVPIVRPRLALGADRDDAGGLAGVLCGGVPLEWVDQVVLPALAANLEGDLALGGERARSICAAMDVDRSCSGGAPPSACAALAGPPPPGCLTPEEVRASEIYRLLLDGAPKRVEGETVLGFAIRVNGVGALFAVP